MEWLAMAADDGNVKAQVFLSSSPSGTPMSSGGNDTWSLGLSAERPSVGERKGGRVSHPLTGRS